MKLLLLLIFWFSLLSLVHTYFFYPLLLRWLGRKKKPNQLFFKPEDDLPFVSVVMAVYNEDKVIRTKLETLLGQRYPMERMAFFIGSDCSSDQTNAIITEIVKDKTNFYFFPYRERRGKPGVINQLASEALRRRAAGREHVFLITDASVFLEEETLYHLVKHFKNPEITIVDAHMKHQGMRSEGISQPENEYISKELMVKYYEGVIWGKMIGPFGGCFALRSDFFFPIPKVYLVDDFFIAMRVFEQGGKAINDLNAVCYETVSHEIREEYRRKARISAGNFQNLFTFVHLWWPPYKIPNFAFFSHKVLRWLGPFFLLGILLTLIPLAISGNLFHQVLFFLMVGGVLGIPLLDLILRKWGINFLLFRGIRYFLWMNIALMEGFIKYLKGIKTNVWEPPKRNS